MPKPIGTKNPNKLIIVDSNTIGIEIDRKHLALIDKADYPLVEKFRWRLHTHGYPQTSICGKTILMHNLILPRPEGWEVDHKNRDKMDNRQDNGNLRLVTHQENSMNRGNYSRVGKHKGVYAIRVNGKKYFQAAIAGVYIGCFPTELEAAYAYDSAAMSNFPEVCITNFQYVL